MLLGFLGVRLPDTVAFLRHRYQLAPVDAAIIADQLEALIADRAHAQREEPV